MATGLRPWHEQSQGLWIGWPGDLSAFTPSQRERTDRELQDRNIVPVHLSGDQIDRYYHGFANSVLWPLFHYLIDRVPVDAAGWDVYREANELFAAAAASQYRPGDTIWVHDYQLMLVPSLLRQRLPDARIGFFLHIPFPSSEVFRILPWRKQILEGLLGADLLGFHTFAYLRHFVASLLHVSGVEADIDRVRLDGREIRLGVFPMGVDAGRFTTLALDTEVAARAATIKRDAGGRTILLGVDRLDYTKGIPRRLQAVERLLERNPGLDATRSATFRSRSRRAKRSIPTSASSARSKRAWGVSTGRAARSVRHPCTTCSNHCPNRNWSPSFSPPTSCSSRRSATG